MKLTFIMTFCAMLLISGCGATHTSTSTSSSLSTENTALAHHDFTTPSNNAMEYAHHMY